MTLKIETCSDDRVTVLRWIGRVESEHVDEVRAHMRRHHPRVALDLDEVTLVDVAVVRFFVACEVEGIELRNCLPYVHEWMARERYRQA